MADIKHKSMWQNKNKEENKLPALIIITKEPFDYFSGGEWRMEILYRQSGSSCDLALGVDDLLKDFEEIKDDR